MAGGRLLCSIEHALVVAGWIQIHQAIRHEWRLKPLTCISDTNPREPLNSVGDDFILQHNFDIGQDFRSLLPLPPFTGLSILSVSGLYGAAMKCSGAL